MREIRISKGGGRYRTVYSPSRGERLRLQRLLFVLMAAERVAAEKAGTMHVAHGFVRGRSPITCALPHIGFPVTMSFDLADWFDSVRPEQIAQGLEAAGADPDLAAQVCYRGAPRQGLPTSPAAANLAAVEFDRSLLVGLYVLNGAWVYTRYADDLTISLAEDSESNLLRVDDAVRHRAHDVGWRVADDKTKIQRRSAGRRVIVGVSVGDYCIKAPRRVRRRLRAALHQGHKCGQQAAGLAEWCAMKLPRACRPLPLPVGPAGPPPVPFVGARYLELR